MLYNVCPVMLYNVCHVMLYNMVHVMLYNMGHDIYTCVKSCYVMEHVPCYVTEASG